MHCAKPNAMEDHVAKDRLVIAISQLEKEVKKRKLRTPMSKRRRDAFCRLYSALYLNRGIGQRRFGKLLVIYDVLAQ